MGSVKGMMIYCRIYQKISTCK